MSRSAARQPLNERFLRCKTISAIATLQNAARTQPISGAAAHKNCFGVGNPAQKCLTGLAVTVVAQRGGDHMLVHRKRQRGGTAAASNAADQTASRTIRNSAAP